MSIRPSPCCKVVRSSIAAACPGFEARQWRPRGSVDGTHPLFKILTINNLPSVFISINWLAGFLPSTVFFFNERWMQVMAYETGTNDLESLGQGCLDDSYGSWKVSDSYLFLFQQKKGTGSKKEALCHHFFVSHGLFASPRRLKWMKLCSMEYWKRKCVVYFQCQSWTMFWQKRYFTFESKLNCTPKRFVPRFPSFLSHDKCKLQATQTKLPGSFKVLRFPEQLGNRKVQDGNSLGEKGYTAFYFFSLFLTDSGEDVFASQLMQNSSMYMTHDVSGCSSALFCTSFPKVCSWDIQVQHPPQPISSQPV